MDKSSIKLDISDISKSIEYCTALQVDTSDVFPQEYYDHIDAIWRDSSGNISQISSKVTPFI